MQKVSKTPATRQDVLNLEKELDRRLNERKAKLAGICPIRREVFHQCFDEIVRQVTIECAERGQLLLRVRDELLATLHTYETLYESSLAFGIRKALACEEAVKKLDNNTKDLIANNKELTDEVKEVKEKAEAQERLANEQRQIDEKRHEDKVQFLKRTNQQLKSQIEAVIAAKSH
ncbi:MAG: Axonemal dynein light intermediate polypeptide 1 [Paramarteilia canceri]